LPPARLPSHSLPQVSARFRLLLKVRSSQDAGAEPGVASKKIFGFALETVKGLASAEPTLALKLFLQGAQASAARPPALPRHPDRAGADRGR